jgi:putative 4-mercaptohistidine N1-methyltranferase
MSCSATVGTAIRQHGHDADGCRARRPRHALAASVAPVSSCREVSARGVVGPPIAGVLKTAPLVLITSAIERYSFVRSELPRSILLVVLPLPLLCGGARVWAAPRLGTIPAKTARATYYLADDTESASTGSSSSSSRRTTRHTMMSLVRGGSTQYCTAAGAAFGLVVGTALSNACARQGARSARQPLSTAAAAAAVRSTTDSGVAGSSVYETDRAVDEYLQFHYAKSSDLMPYPDAVAPTAALEFPQRCARLCLHAEGRARALDIGCSVGGMSFQLARHFDEVKGVDFSHAFVAAAENMRDTGAADYTATIEAEIKEVRRASVDGDIERSRLSFEQGNACALRPDIGQFDAVLAANLLCRLPEPQAFLERCADLVKPGGVLVLVSPYSWLEEYTEKSKWLGGVAGGPKTFDAVQEELGKSFQLLETPDMPFLIREHARKFQWGCSEGSVWRRS